MAPVVIAGLTTDAPNAGPPVVFTICERQTRHSWCLRPEEGEMKINNQRTHQVKRHKDGMQELWRVRLRDIRLQTGLKKQANETHVGGLYQNGPANLRFNSPEGKEST